LVEQRSFLIALCGIIEETIESGKIWNAKFFLADQGLVSRVKCIRNDGASGDDGRILSTQTRDQSGFSGFHRKPTDETQF
jgi:hypothetical protein